MPRFKIGFEQFGVELDGAFVFCASFVGALEIGVGKGQLEVRVGKVWLFSDEFLERRDSSIEIVFVDGGLGFVE